MKASYCHGSQSAYIQLLSSLGSLLHLVPYIVVLHGSLLQDRKVRSLEFGVQQRHEGSLLSCILGCLVCSLIYTCLIGLPIVAPSI